MSTIQKIVDTLKKHGEDKRAQLDRKFEDQSNWLQNEVALIRQLILKEEVASSSGAVTAPAVHVEEKKAPVIEPSTKDESRQKRKSPESSISGFRASPEQKRNSGSDTLDAGVGAPLDIDQIYAAAGLPSDLNKMRKEQLLVELETRGVTSFTMKALKKDLVDALKDLLLKQVTGLPMPPCHSSNSADSADSECSTQTSAPLRKGSLLAEFRKSSVAADPVESEEAKSLRIQSEFEARQQRHRDSQIRKSEAHMEPQASDMDCDTAEVTRMSTASSRYSTVLSVDSSDEDLMGISTGPITAAPIKLAVPAPVAAVVQVQEEGEVLEEHEDKEEGEVAEAHDSEMHQQATEEDLHEEPEAEEVQAVEETEEEEEVHASAPVSAAQSTWMEVSSPVPAKASSQSKTDSHIAESEAEQESESMTIEDTHPEEEEEEEEVEQEEVHAAPVAVQPEVRVAAVPSAPPTESPSHKALIKKPANLMTSSNVGGATSFLDKGPAKPVVAALEKARLLKEAEEAKAMERARIAKANEEMRLKKKETAAAQSSSAPTSKTAQVEKKIASSSSATATAAGAPAPPQSGSGLSTMKKTMNLVGGLLGSKRVPLVGSSSASASSAAPVPVVSKPVTAPMKTQSFDISVVTSTASSARTSPEAVEVVRAPMNVIPEMKPAAVAAPVTKSAPMSLSAPVPVAVPAPVPVAAPVVVPTPAPVAAPTVIHTSAPAPAPAPAPVSQPPREIQPLREVAVIEEDDEIEYNPQDEYPIDDRDNSDESGTDDEDEEKEKEKMQRIPDWARSANLKLALEKQYGMNGHTPMDPDTIFHEVQTCSLEEIFGCNAGKTGSYSKRSSSARWDEDELSLVEKRTYRSQMGFRTSMAPSGHMSSLLHPGPQHPVSGIPSHRTAPAVSGSLLR